MIRSARALLTISLLLTGLYTAPVSAELAIIVHPDNSSTLTDRDVRKIFLGKAKSFKNGSKIRSYEFAAGNSTRTEFLEKVLRKSESALNSHWARMLFSSKAQPPETVNSAAAMKKAVATNPQAIGYINAAEADSSVKVVLTIN